MAARSPQPLKAVQMISGGGDPIRLAKGARFVPTSPATDCREVYTRQARTWGRNFDHLKPQQVSFHELKRSPQSHSQIRRCPLRQRTLGPNVTHESGSIGWNDLLPGEERRPEVG